MKTFFRPVFIYFIFWTLVLVNGVTEEDEGVKYANRCEGIENNTKLISIIIFLLFSM